MLDSGRPVPRRLIMSPVPSDADSLRVQAILASGIKIPPMPRVLLELDALLRDPDAGPADAAHLIATDGALSGAVFRVVGSPVFGLHNRVNSLEHAVSLLGLPAALSIVRGLSLRQAFHDPASQAALERLWQHSGEIAELCAQLARRLRKPGLPPDLAYSVGMFHDCGLALLIKRFPAYAQALQAPAWPDIAALDQTHDTDHALLGQQVARNWQLPESLSLTIRHHADPEAALPPREAQLAALLNLACHLRARLSNTACQEWEAGWRAVSLERLALSGDELAEMENEIAASAGA